MPFAHVLLLLKPPGLPVLGEGWGITTFPVFYEMWLHLFVEGGEGAGLWPLRTHFLDEG